MALATTLRVSCRSCVVCGAPSFPAYLRYPFPSIPLLPPHPAAPLKA